MFYATSYRYICTFHITIFCGTLKDCIHYTDVTSPLKCWFAAITAFRDMLVLPHCACVLGVCLPNGSCELTSSEQRSRCICLYLARYERILAPLTLFLKFSNCHQGNWCHIDPSGLLFFVSQIDILDLKLMLPGVCHIRQDLQIT